MDEARDEALARELARGCPRAYEELYGRFAAQLYRAARTMLRSGSEAEDAVQDVFVNLVQSRHRLAGVANLPAYLFTILRHVLNRRLADRHEQRREMRLLAELAQAKRASDAPPTTADDQLERALAALPDAQREVIALKIHGGLTFAQIAAVLGISVGTAASRYRYALEKLRAAMGEEAM